MLRAFFLTLFLLTGVLCLPLTNARAAEEAGEHAKPKEKEKEKGGEGGEEGGGKSKGPEDVSGGRFAGDPIYVHLEPFVIPVITDDGAEQIVTMLIDLEVKDFDSGDKIHSEMPKIRDALMRYLYGGLGNGDLRNGRMVDVTRIKAKAKRALAEVVGNDEVRDVLIQAVAQRVL